MLRRGLVYYIQLPDGEGRSPKMAASGGEDGSPNGADIPGERPSPGDPTQRSEQGSTINEPRASRLVNVLLGTSLYKKKDLKRIEQRDLQDSPNTNQTTIASLEAWASSRGHQPSPGESSIEFKKRMGAKFAEERANANPELPAKASASS